MSFEMCKFLVIDVCTLLWPAPSEQVRAWMGRVINNSHDNPSNQCTFWVLDQTQCLTFL